MKYSIIYILFLIITSPLMGQFIEIEHDIGLAIGLSNYYGDLNDHFGLRGIGKSGGVFHRVAFGNRYAVKTSVNYSEIGYRDDYSSRAFNQNRNLSFESKVIDINSQFELNFLEYVRSVYYNKQGTPFTPYLAVGFGVFFFNPKAMYNGKLYNLQPLGTEGQNDPTYSGLSKYNLYNFSFNYGGGFKYHVNRNISLSLDFSIRKTFTDYLDDVSGYYSPAISLPDADLGIAYRLSNRSPEIGDYSDKTGKMRGTLDGNDDYVTLQVSISWTFLNSVCKFNQNF